jgi:hypothetical protein
VPEAAEGEEETSVTESVEVAKVEVWLSLAKKRFVSKDAGMRIFHLKTQINFLGDQNSILKRKSECFKRQTNSSKLKLFLEYSFEFLFKTFFTFDHKSFQSFILSCPLKIK